MSVRKIRSRPGGPRNRWQVRWVTITGRRRHRRFARERDAREFDAMLRILTWLVRAST